MEVVYQHAAAELSKRRFPAYGLAGITCILVAEVLLFADIPVIGMYFTPVVWTGYILFVDALNLRTRGSSLLTDRRKEFLFMMPWSVVCWLVFEAYNLLLRNWTYVGLPTDAVPRYIGYVWSFATIFPAVLETTEVLEQHVPVRRGRVLRVPGQYKAGLAGFGLMLLVIPLVVRQGAASRLFGMIWVGFIFLLDPVTYRLRGKSLLRHLEEGNYAVFLALVGAGVLCGLLWEFWNYWAAAKWVYSVPISFVGPKLFEMPLLGYLGFVAFAFECYAMQQFLLAMVPSISTQRRRPR